MTAGALAVGSVSVGTGAAYAHDSVTSSTPAAGAVVAETPQTVTIRFAGNVTRASAEVTNACGDTVPARVAVSGATVSVALGSAGAPAGKAATTTTHADDAGHDTSEGSGAAHATSGDHTGGTAHADDAPHGHAPQGDDAGGAGRWEVRWQAVGSDGHLTSGQVPFSVRDGMCGTATTAPTEENTAPLAEDGGAAPPAAVAARIPMLPIGAAIITLLVLLAIAMNRRRPGQVRP